MLNILVLVSGGGTNLQAIIDRAADGRLSNVRILEVISNNKNAGALERARRAGIDALCISPAEFEERAQFHEALLKEIDRVSPDLIVLAGFLVTIPPEMIRAYRGRIINIHPSLIPSFCGQGYYGLRVHKAALERGVKYSGATVHFVDEGMDSGPIIIQKPVAVNDDDTPESLQLRIMQEAEWEILPAAIQLIADGKVVTDGSRTRILP